MSSVTSNYRYVAAIEDRVTSIYVPKDARLADSAYDTPGSIDILIGAGVY